MHIVSDDCASTVPESNIFSGEEERESKKEEEEEEEVKSYPGTCVLLQVGVNAPGTPIKMTFFPANSEVTCASVSHHRE